MVPGSMQGSMKPAFRGGAKEVAGNEIGSSKAMAIRISTAAVVGLVSLAASLGGCSRYDAESRSRGDELDASVATSLADVGSVAFDLRLSSKAEVRSLDYRLTGNGITPIAGKVDVAASNTARFLVSGIPSGTGFLASLSSISTDGNTTCAGTANFNIAEGQTAQVTVYMQCQGSGAIAGGRIAVDGSFDNCPVLTAVTATPGAAAVGSALLLEAAASDADGDILTFSWAQAPARGTLAMATANANTASSSFACVNVGASTLTVSVSDGVCTGNLDIQVVCTPKPDGAGGAGAAATGGNVNGGPAGGGGGGAAAGGGGVGGMPTGGGGVGGAAMGSGGTAGTTVGTGGSATGGVGTGGAATGGSGTGGAATGGTGTGGRATGGTGTGGAGTGGAATGGTGTGGAATGGVGTGGRGTGGTGTGGVATGGSGTGGTGTGGGGAGGGPLMCLEPSPPTSPACQSCQDCTFGPANPSCLASPEGCANCDPDISGCARFDNPSDRKACEDVYACFITNKCTVAGDPTVCWCGTNLVSCATANSGPTKANGPCVDLVQAAVRLTTYDAATINLKLIDPATPLGRAVNLSTCRASFCQPECNVK